MGFTPIEGLVMGTRCGDLDVGGSSLHHGKGRNRDQIGEYPVLINIPGCLVFQAFRLTCAKLKWPKPTETNGQPLLLIFYNYRVKKYIGSYIAAMGGLDILILTGGIGENSDSTREGVCCDLEFLGISLDVEKNKGFRSEGLISKPESKVKIMVVPTDEELMIALDTEEIVLRRNKS